MFRNKFTKTSNISEEVPLDLGVSAGSYEKGLLQILGRGKSVKVWECWSKRYGGDFIPFASTGFGELFVWNINKKWIEHFCPQTEHFEFIDRDLGWVLNDFGIHLLQAPVFLFQLLQ